MAKDGSARGGARIGAGRKSKSLEEKIIEGKFSDRGFNLNAKDIPTPEPKKYISAEQKMGDKTCAEQVYNETYDWLKACGCAEYVTLQLVETYAQMVGRHIQCEQLLSQLLGGRVCMFRNHSKIMVILGERFDATIESSANVNTNPRTEQAAITVDTELALWYKNIFDGFQSFERHFDDVKPFEVAKKEAENEEVHTDEIQSG